MARRRKVTKTVNGKETFLKMEANNGKGNNPLRDGWQTPKRLFEDLNKQYKFKFDCCATDKNKKCKHFSDDFEYMGIIQMISWMNPPFSIAWRMFEHFFKVVNKGVAIYRCDNFETRLWQGVIFPNCSWVFIPDKRISYEGIDGDGARFPSALIGYHVDPPKELEGTLLIPNCEIGGTRENGKK